MTQAPSQTWIFLYFVAILFLLGIQASQTRREMYQSECNSGLLKWKNKEDCDYILPRTSQIRRTPYRIWEGKGDFHLIGWKHAELSCDFQQPQGLISNIIWYKATKPRSQSYNDIEEKIIFRPLKNEDINRQERIYALSHLGGSSLFIQNVNFKDFGIYRCIASRYGMLSFPLHTEIMTVYKDVEFYPKYLDGIF